MKTKILFLMAVCMMVVSSAIAQTRTIKGRVIADSDGEPLVGASIFEKGSQRHGGYRGVRAASSVSSSPQKSRNERHRSKYKI